MNTKNQLFPDPQLKNGGMRLTRLDDIGQGRCLDGSPGGYYYRSATTNRALHKWLIFLEAGQWCASSDFCAAYHNNITCGSASLPLADTFDGILSRDPNTNPHFYDYHHVFVKSCDGGAFLGSRTEPVEYEGREIYLQGSLLLRRVCAWSLTQSIHLYEFRTVLNVPKKVEPNYFPNITALTITATDSPSTLLNFVKLFWCLR